MGSETLGGWCDGTGRRVRCISGLLGSKTVPLVKKGLVYNLFSLIEHGLLGKYVPFLFIH